VLIEDLTARLPKASADAIVAEARKRLADYAAFDRRVELGISRRRLEELIVTAKKAGDLRVMLAAQRELNRLHGLDRADDTAAVAAADHEALADDVAEARAQLQTLNLSADSSAPLAELARLAVARICNLEAASAATA
jgi:hypothetical protein